jgi:hypothetical protein
MTGTRRRRFFLLGGSIVVLTAAVAPGVYGSSPAKAKVPPKVQSFQEVIEKEPAKVLRVVSGNTLILIYKGRQQLVGLRGVTVPEKNDPRYREMAELLRRALVGKRIEIGFGSPPEVKQDAQGRLLVDLFADGENVNEQVMTQDPLMRNEAASVIAQDSPTNPLPEALPTEDESSMGTATSRSQTPKPNLTKPVLKKVYVRAGDQTYHKARCRLLSNARPIPMLEREAIRAGYQQCRRCRP